MAISITEQDQRRTLPSASRPLDPLTAEEISEASSVLRSERQLGQRVKFETIVLQEPAKDAVLNFRVGDAIQRNAFVVILDNDTQATYEAVVSLDERRVTSWKHILGVQPRVMFDEFAECEAAVRANPEFRAAIQKRGVTDPSLVMVEPWSAGDYGFEDEKGRRLVLARSFLRSSPTDNGYARPVEGVTALVDLNSMEVVRVDDYGFVPLPPNDGNYAAEFVGEFRRDLKPLEITQPEGASFEVVGQSVKWQKWHLRVGFTPREGLVLHTVGYEDQGSGQARPVQGRAIRHGRALWRPQLGPLPEECFRCRGVWYRLSHKLTDPWLRLLGGDLLLRRSHEQRSGRPIHHTQRCVHARGRLRHTLEAR